MTATQLADNIMQDAVPSNQNDTSIKTETSIKSTQSATESSESSESNESTSADSISTTGFLSEGSATIPYKLSDGVFYNPIQCFNRDLSIVMLNAYGMKLKLEFNEKQEKRKQNQLTKQEKLKENNNSNQTNESDSKRQKNQNGTSNSIQSSNSISNSSNDQPRSLRVLEALSATGLRSIRYNHEITTYPIDSILVNDMDYDAVESIKSNLIYNKVSLSKCIPKCSDAADLMYKHRQSLNDGKASIIKHHDKQNNNNNDNHNNKDDDDSMQQDDSINIDSTNQEYKQVNLPFDVIDLDPYGSASPFIDSAVQSINSGGILCITCTDKSNLCGNNAETTFVKYGSYPLKSSQSNEQAIRIVLTLIHNTASKYRKYIKPLLSCSIDFYVRVFVRIYDSPEISKFSASKMANIIQCLTCESWKIQPLGSFTQNQKTSQKGNINTITKFSPSHIILDEKYETDISEEEKLKQSIDSTLPPLYNSDSSKCTYCSHSLRLGGPLYIGELHDLEFIKLAQSFLKQTTIKYPLKTKQRIQGLLHVCSLELPQILYFHSLPKLHQILHIQQSKSSIIRSAIINAGYKISQSHCTTDAIKTSAPHHIIWNIMCNIGKKQIQERLEKSQKSITNNESNENDDETKQSKSLKRTIASSSDPRSVDAIIYRRFSKLVGFTPDFTYVPGSDLSSKSSGIPVYIPNPPNSGPKSMAHKLRSNESSSNDFNSMDQQMAKSRANQGKKRAAKQAFKSEEEQN